MPKVKQKTLHVDVFFLFSGDATKRLFNYWHSSLRQECTENIFGLFKRRWPVVKNMRWHYWHAVEAILACAVLHNVGVRWRDEVEDLPPEDDEPLLHDGRVNEDGMHGMAEHARRMRERQEGAEVREQIVFGMEGPSERELRKM